MLAELIIKVNVVFQWALYVHPIFSVDGDYHPVVKERVAAKSAAQGFPRTRLQEFSQEGYHVINIIIYASI